MLTKRLLYLSGLLLVLNTSFAQPALDTKLFELPDVIFTKIEAPKGYSDAFELRVKQAIDHKNPSSGHFYQKVFLTHKGFDRPTVMVTEGYSRASNRMYELSQLLEANQILVEHRFFGESMPDKPDYAFLNLEQVAADLHKINQLFRQLYNGKWLSTGISKGGQTTIFYRYFYPDDVDVSVPYVAPLNLYSEDTRIYNFLDTIGPADCRAKIRDLQTRLLKNRDKVMPLLRWYGKGAGLDFNYLTFEQAFEYAILEYPFSFWQWGHNCADIPNDKIPLEDALQHFVDVSGLDFFSDKSMEEYASHYYQAGAEMGYYGYETKQFKGLLKALPMTPNPTAVFTPNKMEVAFDGSLARKVYDWLTSNGNNFIYINGATDTWSATAVPKSASTNSLWFNLAGKDHAKARIRSMNVSEKELMISTLEKWMSMTIKRTE